MGSLLSMGLKMQNNAVADGSVLLQFTAEAGSFGQAAVIRNGITYLSRTTTGTLSGTLAYNATFQGAVSEFSAPAGFTDLTVYSNIRGYLFSSSASAGIASDTYTRIAGEDIIVTANIYAPYMPPPCFVAGTMIKLSNGTEAAIETLSKGIELESALINTLEDTNDVHALHMWSSSDLIEKRTKSSISKFYPEEVYYTIIVNGSLLEATRNHIQLARVNGIWRMINMEHLAVGDYLYNHEGQLIEVTSIEINTEPRTVYKLTLSDTSHTYFANNILTHNIKIDEF